MSFRRPTHVLGLFGTIMKWFSLVFLVPLAFALGHGTPLMPFLVPMAVGLVLGLVLERIFPETDLEMADGFLLVVLTWLGVSLLGAIPYVLTGIGTLANPVNAFFESVSGFTCTGSTVMGVISLEKYPHSIMIWRQLTQWLGGMGILVLAVAILPRLAVGGTQFLDFEMSGPQVDRLTPHMAATARRLWVLYVGLSVVLFVILLGLHYTGVDPLMDPFQALAHVLTTIPSGGFSPMGDSVGAFSAAVQWVIIPFMWVAAVNFALMWRALFTGPRVFWEDTEWKVYTGIFLGVGLALSVVLIAHGQFETLEENLRHGFFQMATFLTTTGFASTDFAVWSGDALALLVLLMFIAGCVGSTSGGLKVMRWIVVVKAVVREMIQQVHPSSVQPLRMGARPLKENVIRGAIMVVLAYFLLFGLSLVLISIDARVAGLDVTAVDVTTAITATLGNIGPGFGAVGPMENFEFFPELTKLWMCFLMIAGRLEIMTLLVIMMPVYWRK